MAEIVGSIHAALSKIAADIKAAVTRITNLENTTPPSTGGGWKAALTTTFLITTTTQTDIPQLSITIPSMAATDRYMVILHADCIQANTATGTNLVLRCFINATAESEQLVVNSGGQVNIRMSQSKVWYITGVSGTNVVIKATYASTAANLWSLSGQHTSLTIVKLP